MKTSIVADGALRLRQSPEFQARLRELRESVRARHAAELAAAGWLGRFPIWWRMAVEYRRERRKLVPSAGALYLSRVAADGAKKI